MPKISKNLLIPVLVIASILSFHGTAVSAKDTFVRPIKTSDTTEPVPPNIQNTDERFLQDKLKVCQSHEKSIRNRSTKLIQLVTVMEDKFTKISNRVIEYYKNTVVVSGKKVANYDALIKDIQNKKELVQSDLDKSKLDIAQFNCSSGRTLVQLVQFRKDMQLVKTDLKNYRVSVKNLIVAVHSVVGEENNSSNTAPSTNYERRN